MRSSRNILKKNSKYFLSSLILNTHFIFIFFQKYRCNRGVFSTISSRFTLVSLIHIFNITLFVRFFVYSIATSIIEFVIWRHPRISRNSRLAAHLSKFINPSSSKFSHPIFLNLRNLLLILIHTVIKKLSFQ